MKPASPIRGRFVVVEGGATSVASAGDRDLDWAILMSRAQAGEAAAYRRLLRAITPFVRSIVARRHRDPADVEDCVQDVLMSVHAIRDSYDPARPFGPWLVAIANRRSIDHLRRRLRRNTLESTWTADAELHASVDVPAPDPFEDAELERAVESLPEQQRTAIRLLKLGELSLEEAAARTNSTTGALKVATHRALRALRARLVDRSRS